MAAALHSKLNGAVSTPRAVSLQLDKVGGYFNKVVS
jgi:hypothetical protein